MHCVVKYDDRDDENNGEGLEQYDSCKSGQSAAGSQRAVYIA